MAKIIDYGCGKVEIEASVWTLAVYEQEFHTDLIQDFYGKVMLEEDEDGTGALIFNYNSKNWYCILKALWACIKANNDTTPSFREWAKNTKGFNMHKIWASLAEVFNENFFRPDTPDTEEEDGEQRQEKE